MLKLNCKTIIFGKRSFLSQELKKKINNSVVISVEDFFNDNKIIEKYNNKKINIIINSFFPSSQLSKIVNYQKFYKKSIEDLSRLLDALHCFSINKIIYSSSSSIYNSYNNFKKKDSSNRKIYSSSKFACENLIANFCQKKNISFNICRIFNMYGNNDSFSIISKIIKCYKTRNKLLLNNNGKSIRDFINVVDVANTYKKILSSKNSEILDLGNGFGYEINDILTKIGKKNFNIKNLKIEEQPSSIAKNIYQKNAIYNKNSNLENYLKKKLGIKKHFKFTKIYSSKNNLINETITKPTDDENKDFLLFILI